MDQIDSFIDSLTAKTLHPNIFQTTAEALPTVAVTKPPRCVEHDTFSQHNSVPHAREYVLARGVDHPSECPQVRGQEYDSSTRTSDHSAAAAGHHATTGGVPQLLSSFRNANLKHPLSGSRSDQHWVSKLPSASTSCPSRSSGYQELPSASSDCPSRSSGYQELPYVYSDCPKKSSGYQHNLQSDPTECSIGSSRYQNLQSAATDSDRKGSGYQDLPSVATNCSIRGSGYRQVLQSSRSVNLKYPLLGKQSRQHSVHTDHPGRVAPISDYPLRTNLYSYSNTGPRGVCETQQDVTHLESATYSKDYAHSVPKSAGHLSQGPQGTGQELVMPTARSAECTLDLTRNYRSASRKEVICTQSNVHTTEESVSNLQVYSSFLPGTATSTSSTASSTNYRTSRTGSDGQFLKDKNDSDSYKAVKGMGAVHKQVSPSTLSNRILSDERRSVMGTNSNTVTERMNTDNAQMFTHLGNSHIDTNQGSVNKHHCSGKVGYSGTDMSQPEVTANKELNSSNYKEKLSGKDVHTNVDLQVDKRGSFPTEIGSKHSVSSQPSIRSSSYQPAVEKSQQNKPMNRKTTVTDQYKNQSSDKTKTTFISQNKKGDEPARNSLRLNRGGSVIVCPTAIKKGKVVPPNVTKNVVERPPHLQGPLAQMSMRQIIQNAAIAQFQKKVLNPGFGLGSCSNYVMDPLLLRPSPIQGQSVVFNRSMFHPLPHSDRPPQTHTNYLSPSLALHMPWSSVHSVSSVHNASFDKDASYAEIVRNPAAIPLPETQLRFSRGVPEESYLDRVNSSRSNLLLQEQLHLQRDLPDVGLSCGPHSLAGTGHLPSLTPVHDLQSSIHNSLFPKTGAHLTRLVNADLIRPSPILATPESQILVPGTHSENSASSLRLASRSFDSEQILMSPPYRPFSVSSFMSFDAHAEHSPQVTYNDLQMSIFGERLDPFLEQFFVDHYNEGNWTMTSADGAKSKPGASDVSVTPVSTDSNRTGDQHISDTLSAIPRIENDKSENISKNEDSEASTISGGNSKSQEMSKLSNNSSASDCPSSIISKDPSKYKGIHMNKVQDAHSEIPELRNKPQTCNQSNSTLINASSDVNDDGNSAPSIVTRHRSEMHHCSSNILETNEYSDPDINKYISVSETSRSCSTLVNVSSGNNSNSPSVNVSSVNNTASTAVVNSSSVNNSSSTAIVNVSSVNNSSTAMVNVSSVNNTSSTAMVNVSSVNNSSSTAMVNVSSVNKNSSTTVNVPSVNTTPSVLNSLLKSDNRSQCPDLFRKDSVKSHEVSHSSRHRHQCAQCSRSYKDSSSLKRHQRVHSGKRDHKCIVCGKSFFDSYALDSHVRVHTRERSHKCPICGKCFSHASQLQVHKSCHTGLRPYRCTKCGKAFSKSSKLRVHLRSHSGVKPFCCEVCSKRFTVSSNLKAHMRTHTGPATHRCETCNKVFFSMADFSSHTKTHTSFVSYNCNLCDKKFVELSKLEEHYSSHTSEKCFQCNICGKGFKKIHQMISHEAAHKKSTSCEICQKVFKSKEDVSRHQQEHGEKSSTKRSVDANGSEQPKCRCEICDKVFLRFSILKEHLNTHTGQKPYKCSSCEQAFCSRGGLRKHTKKHHKENGNILKENIPGRKNICDICGRLFKQLCHLKVHKRIHLGEKPYLCEFCGKRFRDSGIRNRHVKIHTGEKPHQCSICTKSFTDSGSLQKHIAVHTKPKQHVCKTCGKGFNFSGDLKVHERSHSGEKPFKCETCGKGFAKSSKLVLHRRTHSGVKPFTCPVCTRSFSVSSNLQAHLKTHTNMTTFRCPKCSRTLCSKQSLEQHLRESHSSISMIPCPQCNKQFIDNDRLKEHMFLHNKVKPFSCSQCGKSFIRRHNLQHHESCHSEEKTHNCQKCDLSFQELADLQKHELSHRNDSCPCEQCQESFSTPTALHKHFCSVHAKTGDFTCSVCSKVFKRRADFDVHGRTHTRQELLRCSICHRGFCGKSGLRKHTRQKHTEPVSGDQNVCGSETNVPTLTDSCRWIKI